MSKYFNAWETTCSSSAITTPSIQRSFSPRSLPSTWKTGKGVTSCTDFPTDAKMQFMKKVYPSLLGEEETQMKESGPPAKNRPLF